MYKNYKKETGSLTEADKKAANSITPIRSTPSSTPSSTPLRDPAEQATTGKSGGVSTKGPLPSFWIPMLTPQAEKSKVDKPDKTIYCPMSGAYIHNGILDPSCQLILCLKRLSTFNTASSKF